MTTRTPATVVGDAELATARPPGPVGPAALVTGGRWRATLRFVAAVAVSAAICLVLRRVGRPTLSGPTDVVGYPIAANYNYLVPFWSYRLAVYAFPFLAIVGYAVLARFGPLRSSGRPPRARPVELLQSPPRAADEPARPGWGVVPRLLLPAGVVVVAGGARTGHTDVFAIVAGVVYLALVAGCAEVWARRTDGQRWRTLSIVNGGAGAIAALSSLWFVSAHTVVRTSAGEQHWPWFAWWLAVPGLIAIGWWAGRQLRHGRAARDVELTLLTVVVGAVAVFLAVSVLPGEITFYQGYDDALELAGASLLSRGFFPWRDLLSIHGVFPDILTGTLGRAVFGDSVWGVFAIHSVVLVPLCWVAVYLFAAWVSRRNPWFLAVVFLAAISGLLPLLVAERFMLVPVTLIVLGETLRRRSAAWAVTLTLLLFAQAILVPETSFLAAPVLAVVVAADRVHRREGQNLWGNLRITRWCVATGAVALALWAAFLAAFGALRPFIDYYVVFGPGHNESGAIPPTGIMLREQVMFGSAILAILLTVWATAAKVARRSDWDALDWVAVAAAGFVALYTEKALGRFDFAHVWQGFGAGLSLMLLWAWRLLSGADGLVGAWGRGRPARLGQPVTVATVVVVALGLVYAGPLADVARKSDEQHILAGVSQADYPRLGYAKSGAIDTAMLRDLDATLRTYAGGTGLVFDMTNAVGYLYYLLGREPGTRFVPVSLAIPHYAQQLVIGELAKSRPPVVVFDSTTIGLPIWDHLASDVRHYEISEYVLRGWTPVIRTHGVLIMVRNDLVAAGLPAPPALSQAPQTTDLYFSGPSCWWGAAPNYLSSLPDGGKSVVLPVRPDHSEVVKDQYGVTITRAFGRVDVPAGLTLSDYDLVTLSTSGVPIGEVNVSLVDQPGVPFHDISATALPVAGPALTLRVGSCPQWYAYDTAKPLYVVQDGGTPVTSLTLSVVRR